MAEYRLTLRADNADQRLTTLGEGGGVVGSGRSSAFGAKLSQLTVSRETLRNLSLTPSQANLHGLGVRQDGVRRNGSELLSLAGFPALCRIWPELGSMEPAIV